MSKIIYSHIYGVAFIAFDKIKNTEDKHSLMAPYTSEEYIDPKEVEKIYINNNSFDNMVSIMVEKEFYKNQGYTKDSLEYRGVEVKYLGKERWWLIWFCHETRSKFDNDQEAFTDFESFLREKKVKINYSSLYSDYDHSGYCAMGAEDHWRWELCSCEHCLKSGRTLINH